MHNRERFYKRPIFRLLALMIVIIPLIILVVIRVSASAFLGGSDANITIDYTHQIRTLDPLAVGGVDESAYGAPNVLINDPLQQQRLRTLGTRYMRINLRYAIAGNPRSPLICGAHGCDTRWSGDAWVNAIKALGAEPVLEDPVNPGDLPALVKHFNKDTHNYVKRWLGGINEPNMHGQNGTTYSQNFNVTYDAMKAVDPTILIGGPTLAWYDPGFLQTFLKISGSRVDFLDFHGYAQGATQQLSYPALFAKTAQYETDINNLYRYVREIVPQRASSIEIEVGEWDLDSDGHLLEYTQFTNVWGASTIGHILRAGAIDLVYADKGNLLLKMGTELPGGSLDQTTPMYHALGMYTGENLFRRFGTVMVQATSTLPNVEVYASDNDKNIVVINTSATATQTGKFQLQGLSTGTVAQWRKDQSIALTAAPRLLNTLTINNGGFSATLPPFSVTTFVIDPNSSSSFTVPPQGSGSTPTVLAGTAVAQTAIPPASPTPTTSATGNACVGDGVYVYRDSNYRGVCENFTTDIPDFAQTTVGNDVASSIRIVGPYTAILYKDSQYRNTSSTVTANVPNLSTLAVGTDALTSLRVQRR
ncbi:GH39 family glycosyl hydrolase [Dictyobacter arantiisoli]|uniref:Glycosyl hydrolases family 39 N-terminal catalytic domain-containing protein n=1 Tax=Dictyobacter arantiisoli TaxID=2014874 RepID=A0A5A5TFE1_9CHLR|nr:hypothetical protein [Dictyobacter arantiisoli]GCF10291.1 hypothetical protein KDI_38550 [Dictyobacter arantiisoli]